MITSLWVQPYFRLTPEITAFSRLAIFQKVCNAPINVKPAGGRQGIGWDFDIFPNIAVKFPSPGQKYEAKYN